MKAQSQPAFVIHRMPYSESSLLVDLFTEQYGRLTVLAKGARRLKSRNRGILLPFQPLLVGWAGRGELPILTSAEMTAPYQELRGQDLYCGFYLSELLTRLLHRYDPHEHLYSAFETAIETLANAKSDVDNAWTLRLFERDLLREMGYAMLLSHEADSDTAVEFDADYQYLINKGPVRLPVRLSGQQRNGSLNVTGQTLLAMHRSSEPTEQSLRESKQLTRAILNRYLDGKPVHTRRLIRQINP